MGLTSELKPLVARHKHDCGHCILIGQTTNDDVYYCPPNEDLVLRDGDDLGEFAAFPMSVARLAAEKGNSRGNRWGVACLLWDIAKDDGIVSAD